MLFNESPDASGYPRKAFFHVTTAADKQALLDTISGLRINPTRANASTAEAFTRRISGSPADRSLGEQDGDQARRGSFHRCQQDSLCIARPRLRKEPHHLSGQRQAAGQRQQRACPAASDQIRARTQSIPVAEGVGNSDEANWADEFAAFFNRGADLDTTLEGAQNISVHTLAVTGASSDGNYPNFIRWIAKEGGGLYQQASNSDEIVVGLTKIFNQVRAANSVFSSASLPVSANTQGTYLNQVYIGMFRPDGNALPRWVGNLKQYQFVYNVATDTLQLADSSLVPAVSPTTGFIDSDATSFWTSPSSFWINVEAASSGRYSRSDAPDGERVEKGGVAQWLRTRYWESRADRPVYTCVGSGCDGGTTGIDLACRRKQLCLSDGQHKPDRRDAGRRLRHAARAGDPLDPRTRQRHHHQRRQ